MTTRFTAFEFPVSATDAEDRNTPDRLRDHINVLDFGADPTGVEDSLAAFDAAILAARSPFNVAEAIRLNLAEGGSRVAKACGIIYVPRGKYFVSDKINIIIGASGGFGQCVTIRGESAASTMIYGDVNGFLLDTGYANGMNGGCTIEHLSVYNYNTTAYSSGCIYNACYESVTRNCIIYTAGGVGLAIQSLTMFMGSCYNCVFLGPGADVTASIGCSQSSSGTVLSSCYFKDWGQALDLCFDACSVLGCYFENNRIAIHLGDKVNSGFQANPASGFGANNLGPFNILGNTFKSNGTSIQSAIGSSARGVLAGFHVDCTPAAAGTISTSGNVLHGIKPNSLLGGTIANGTVTGGPIEGYAYYLRPSETGGTGSNNTIIGCITDVDYADRWFFPGTTNPIGTPSPGGVAQSGNATASVFLNSDTNPVWVFNDLPFARMLEAFITDFTLSFSSTQEVAGTFGLTNGAYIFGTGVEPGTRNQTRGTLFNNPIIDSGDGTGAYGNVLTFLGTPTGPPPIEGARLMIEGGSGNAWCSGYIDDGSGTIVDGAVTNPGNIFTITTVGDLINATIKNEAGDGPGNFLTFTSKTNADILNSFGAKGAARIAIDVDGADGIPRDTWIVDGPYDVDRKVWSINRDLDIDATTIHILPDFRANNSEWHSDSSPWHGVLAPDGAKLTEELALNQWLVDCDPIAYGPNTPLVFKTDAWPSDIYRNLGPRINDNQWEVTGAEMNYGVPTSIKLPDTFFVNISQSTGAPQTMTYVYDTPGNTYLISDSTIPAWSIPSSTVKIMPLGDSITQGQNTSYGAYRRLLYDLLTDDDVDVDFVGSYSHGSFADPDHEGLTGDPINGAWGRVATDLIIEDFAPDVILLLIGTNDALASSPAVTMLGTMDSLLNSIITHGPGVKVIVGSIPPLSNSTANGIANTFNAALPALVASKGANFSFIDINAGMTTGDLADGVHPTDAGNDKMAYIWKPAVMAAIGTSNVGKPITVGGGSHRVRVRFSEHFGYTIAG